MSTQRPSTAQRDRGRIPLTVLAAEHRPGQELLLGSAPAAASLLSSTSGAQGSATSRSDASATSSQQDRQLQARANLHQPPVQQAQSSTQPASLKVALSPQRPRTIISFENRCWSSEGPGSKPVLTMFPHTEGAKVGRSAGSCRLLFATLVGCLRACSCRCVQAHTLNNAHAAWSGRCLRGCSRSTSCPTTAQPSCTTTPAAPSTRPSLSQCSRQCAQRPCRWRCSSPCPSPAS